MKVRACPLAGLQAPNDPRPVQHGGGVKLPAQCIEFGSDCGGRLFTAKLAQCIIPSIRCSISCWRIKLS